MPRIILSDHVPSSSRRACVVSRTAYEALREIDEGLVHARRFWETFSANTFKDSVGARGVSVRMRSIQDAATVAFAFKDVLNLQGPTVTHTNALVELYRHIKPDLDRRPWPPDRRLLGKSGRTELVSLSITSAGGRMFLQCSTRDRASLRQVLAGC